MSEDVTVSRADWERDAERLRRVRNEVFVAEQQVPLDIEFDGRDSEAAHFMAVDGHGQVIGTARLLPDGQIGRMAVLQRHRGRGIGRRLLDKAVETARDFGHWRVFHATRDPAAGTTARKRTASCRCGSRFPAAEQRPGTARRDQRHGEPRTPAGAHL